MPFFAEKFFADTLHLPWDARAVYLELLAIAWNRGGSLPDDPNQLRLMIGCYSKAWGRIWREIVPFWTLAEDGRLHQKRLDKEWQRVLARHAQSANQKPTNGAKRKNPDGKKPNDYSRALARESHTHTHTQNSLPYGRENSEGAPAALSVRAHASPDAPSPNGEAEHSPPVDDAARARIAEGLKKLAASITIPDRLNEPAAGTIAEIERQAAAEKLAQWAATPLPALSPTALASPRLGYVNGHHALPKARPSLGRKRRRHRANGACVSDRKGNRRGAADGEG